MRWEEGSGNPSCIGFVEDEKLLKSGSLAMNMYTQTLDDGQNGGGIIRCNRYESFFFTMDYLENLGV